MELPHRDPGDVFVPVGEYRRVIETLQSAAALHQWSTVIAYAFDYRTRLMPFRFLDRKVVPCGVRSLAAALLECGFDQIRVVLQQWTPNFLPSEAVRHGHPIDILMVSSMGMHADEAYRLVKDAHRLGDDRPLILMGGPKAMYEPEDCFGIGEDIIGAGADLACTGEEFVLLDFLRLMADHTRNGEHPLKVFRRIRGMGLLDEVPGLVYRAPDHDLGRPYLINTGVQRLVQDMDDLPMPLAGMTRLEPAHRKRFLSQKPCSLPDVRKKSKLATLVATHGCRFNCDFCPIPAYQQRTWRHKSPERLADEMKQLGEEMNYRYFFGTDDNFFNDRASAEAILTAMSRSNIHGQSFKKVVHFITEATEFDVFKHRDLLPLANEAGLKTIFFGIEDLNAKLINKGQTVNKTEELFRDLTANSIAPYAMMIHHDDQPLWSRDPGRLGVVNQAMRLFSMGAVGYHSTYITPSMGARNVETMFGSGDMIRSIGGKPLPEAFLDGNHVVATRHRRAWVRQLQLWAAYVGFYNPINFGRTLFKDLRDRNKRRRLKWQIVGASMILPSILKSLPFVTSLAFRKVEKHTATPPRCLPMIDAKTRERVRWGVDAEVAKDRRLPVIGPHAPELYQLEPRAVGVVRESASGGG